MSEQQVELLPSLSDIVSVYRLTLRTWIGKLHLAGGGFIVANICIRVLLELGTISLPEQILWMFESNLVSSTASLILIAVFSVVYLWVWYTYGKDLQKKYQQELHRQAAQFDDVELVSESEQSDDS